jgi:hypothetical protein
VAELFRSYAVATGKDIMAERAAARTQMAQGQLDKTSRQMSAQNQILGLKEGLPAAPTPVTNTLGSIFGAALGIGKDFMQDTTKLTGAAANGGIFGSGGILGIGRDWG